MRFRARCPWRPAPGPRRTGAGLDAPGAPPCPEDGSKTDLNPENMKLTDVVDRLRNDLGRYRLGEWREELSKPLESVGE